MAKYEQEIILSTCIDQLESIPEDGKAARWKDDVVATFRKVLILFHITT